MIAYNYAYIATAYFMFSNICIKYAVADIVEHINYNIIRHFLRLSMKNCDIWRIIFLEVLICLHKSLTVFKYILWMNIVIR